MRVVWRRVAVTVAVALLVGLGLPRAALAAVDLDGFPADLGALTGGNSSLAAGLDGRVAAIWPVSDSPVGRAVQGAWRSPTGGWGTPVTVAQIPSYRSSDLAVTTDGRALAVWTISDGGASVQWSTSTGGAWSSGATLAPALALGALDVEVVAGPGGTAIAVWTERLSGGEAVRAARWDGSAWSAADTLTSDGSSLYPARAALGPGGVATVVYGEEIGGVQTIRSRSWDGSSWSPAVTVSDPSRDAFEPAVAATTGGDAVAVWSARAPGGDDRIEAASGRAGSWTAPTTVWSDSAESGAVELAAGPDGSVSAVWRTADGSDRTVATATWASGWSAPAEVAGAEAVVGRPEIAVGADGTVAIVAALESATGDRVDLVIRRPGGSWSPPQPVSSIGTFVSQPRVAVAPTGRVVMTWTAFPGAGTLAERRIRTIAGSIPGASPPGPFADVPAGTFFTAPVGWARDTGLTTGVGGADVFEPNRSITRGETITLLWRLVGGPAAPPSGFADVPARTFFSAAVGWARDTGLTTGVGGANVFEPDRSITRAETITLLYRLVASTTSLASVVRVP